jgi:hypothetical protein
MRMTPTDPPPGLLDKLAEALAKANGWSDVYRDLWAEDARAAWDAVAEGLGLREALIFGGRRHLVSDPLEPQP